MTLVKDNDSLSFGVYLKIIFFHILGQKQVNVVLEVGA
jgi:hypothetical protein